MILYNLFFGLLILSIIDFVTIFIVREKKGKIWKTEKKKKEKQSKEKIKKLRTKQSMYEIENLRYQGLVGSE